ncbi:MAG: hypothetical protein AAFN94_11535 [Pseudomonadota bacterium]
MPLDFRIFPERGLVVVRYEGMARVADTMRVFGEYAAHPDFSPGQKQLVDLTALTDYERDFAAVMELQAAKADHLAGPGAQSLIVYLAPGPVAREMSALITRSWEDVDAVIACILESEAEALEVLGQKERSLAELYAATGGDALQ